MVDGRKLPLLPLCGRPLVAHTIEQALQAPGIDRVIVSTEDPEIAEAAVSFGAEVPLLRPRELARPSVHVEASIRHLLESLEREEDYRTESVAILHFVCPFLRSAHITEAIDTMRLYKADSVISVCQDLTFHWRRGKEGLEMVGYQQRLFREEKETIFKENGALYVTSARLIRSGGFLGSRVSYIEMSPEESVRLQSDFDFWLAGQMLKEGRFVQTA
jgi:CMP-N-acetylneuraminic acid synthetase